MNNLNNNRYKNVLGIISVTKLGILLFISIIVINKMEIIKLSANNSLYNNSTNLIISIIIAFLIIIYLFWSYAYLKEWDFSKFKIIQLVENVAYTIILSILIFSSNTYQGEYNFLFSFGIISTTIVLGKKYGVILAVLSSGFILSFDLILPVNSLINTYFQNDLVLSFGFIVLAWILGEYVTLENDRIQGLETELTAQIKQYDYIAKMLLRNDSCYDLLIKHSHDAIFIHNNNEIFYLNEKALNLAGITSADKIIHNSIHAFTYIDNLINLNRMDVDNIKNEKKEICFEKKVVNENGTILNMENTSTYFFYEKKPAILTILRDITPEKQVQILKKDVERNIELLNESKEYNKFITDFFINISHELKTPLNVIFSSLQLLTLYNENYDKDVIKKKKNYLVVMKQNCYRLLKLINNLLELARLDAGFVSIRLKNINIVDFIENITLSVVPYAESKGVNIIFDTDVEEKIMACDTEKIERIILNLLSNALKFTDAGGEIFVNIADNEDMIEVSVKDTGIGMPEDKLNTIFQRFMQIDKTLHRNAEGSGIGLSLVKSFVELHGGEIKVKSKINEGSEFTLFLPVKQVEEDITYQSEINSNISEKVNMELSDIYSDTLKSL
jgi:PAS domain S-box-containing protein